MTGSIFSDPKVEEVILPTAKVFQFPVPGEARPEDRLVQALEALDTALEGQKVALATWSVALVALQASTSGLSDSLQRYKTCLEALGDQGEELHGRAITMEQWANDLLTK